MRWCARQSYGRVKTCISAAQRLLSAADLEDKIVSGDAIFAQRELSRTVVEGGGDYLWKLKANQGQLHKLAQEHFAHGADKYLGQAHSLEKGHGRIDEREILTSFRVAAQMAFPYVEQVFRITRQSARGEDG